MRRPWADTDDAFLKRHAATQSCAWIGERLKRSSSSVHGRAKKLGVSMIKSGAAHHKAKATRQAADMITLLNDNGYTPVEIHALFDLGLSRGIIEDICASRTWRTDPVAV